MITIRRCGGMSTVLAAALMTVLLAPVAGNAKTWHGPTRAAHA